MAQMTPGAARLIDPVLSTVAQGYKNSEMIAQALFPIVGTPLRGGKILSFGKEDFMLYATKRAPGENTKRIQFGYAGLPYSLEDFSLEGQVPKEVYEDASVMPGIDHGEVAVNKVQDIMFLRLEYAASVIARNASNYGAGNKVTKSGTGQWSDFTSGISDPVADIETAKEAVRAATGKRPNTVIMGAAVFAKCKQHPKIVDRIKYTQKDVATPELLAALFGVDRVLIGDAIYSNDAGTAFTDVWGKDVVVAYTNTDTVANMGAPSYGYTYMLEGHPFVEVPYHDRSAKSWIYPVTRCEAPVLAAASAGYLITNAVA